MADRRAAGIATGSRLYSFLFFLAAPSFAAPPADMEAAIVEYEADQRSVTRFYDLPWSTARFDRTDRLQHDWQAGSPASTSIGWTRMAASIMCSCERSWYRNWTIRHWTGAG